MRILGISDDVTTCQCCGKSGLKSTVIVMTGEDEIAYYGCVCATRHTGKQSKQIRDEARSAFEARRQAARRDLEARPEYLALRAKRAAAHASRLIGKPFALYCEAEQKACDLVRRDLAATYGLKVYELL